VYEIEEPTGVLFRAGAPRAGAGPGASIRKSSAPLHPALVWALLVTCNLIWAGQFVMVKLVQAQPGPIMTKFLPTLLAVILLAPIALTLEPLTAGDLRSLTAIICAGIGALAVFVYMRSMLVFFAALERLEAIQASLGNYLIPFFGLITAAVALGERLTWAIVVGGLLTLGSTVLGTIERKAST
jgi:drug/metabolite transporter (DMT)-like permease